MKTSSPSIEKIGIKVGFVTFLSLVAYFMIMKFLGLSHVLELRFFNIVILAIGISYGIKKIKRTLQESDFYLKGWAGGMFVSVVSTVLFALFMSLYLSYFDESLMQHIRETTTLGFTVASGFNVFFAVFMEGMASAVVITLAAMQYFKTK
ncbi:MAG: hypothetical protein K8R85_07580 [Bacteroidetes bacterium]|nr:hypothetical protein [Bacteroidota bacterium]